jgi:hypothetical protein
MTRRPLLSKRGFASLARTSLLSFTVALACGGKSIRHIDDEGTGGEAGDPTAGGGSGAVDPFTGGTSGTSGTGGTFPGGTSGTGGTFPGGTTGTGGTIPVGGTFPGGTSGTGGTSFTGGTAGTGTGGCYSGPEPIIPWDFDGAIYYDTNPYGINGGWYTFDDCSTAISAGLPCTVRNPMLKGPDGDPGWLVQEPVTVCASGTAPRVMIGPDGTPAYGLQWGFGMGFSVNGGAPFNAASQCVRGFYFELSGTAPVTLRINVVTPTNIGESHFVETALSPMAFVDFASARQGSWVANPTRLDITQITDIQFHVYTNEAMATPFNFCVRNVRALR